MIECSDGKVRKCVPVVASWLRDLIKKTKRLALKSMSCPNCETPKSQYERYAPEGGSIATRDHLTYQEAFLTQISATSPSEILL